MNKKLLEYVKVRFVSIAQDLMKNPQGLKYKLERAWEKIDAKGVREALGQNVEDMKVLIRMARSWVSKSYREVSTQSIVFTIAAIIYFVTPTDFLPDFVLGLGFLDDIAVLRWVIGQIKSDLEKFKSWEENKGDSTNSPKEEE